MYAILADLITTIHFAYVAFVVIAQLLILVGILLRWKWIRNPWFRCIHLAMILIVALEAMGGIECPLTVWDSQLRAMAGQETQEGTFVGNLLWSILYFDATQYRGLLTSIYYGFAVLVLVTFLLAPPRLGRTLKEAPATPPASSQC